MCVSNWSPGPASSDGDHEMGTRSLGTPEFPRIGMNWVLFWADGGTSFASHGGFRTGHVWVFGAEAYNFPGIDRRRVTWSGAG